MQLMMSTSHLRAPAQILAIPLLIQLPANVTGKAAWET